MKYVVYLDTFWFFNMVMDFLALMIIRRLESCKRNWKNSLMAAVLGANFAVAGLFWKAPKIAWWILTYGVIGPGMISISMEWKGIRNHFRRVVYLYFGMFLCSGMLLVVCSGAGQEALLYQYTGLYGRVNGKVCVAMMVFFYGGVRELVGNIRGRLIRQGTLMKVWLKIEGKTLELQALCDTGNRLVEPISGKPVCVLKKSTIEQLNLKTGMPIYIPYHTVGKSKGMMEGIWGERLRVQEKEFEKIPLAIAPNGMGKSKEYDIILPPEYFIKEGKWECEKCMN